MQKTIKNKMPDTSKANKWSGGVKISTDTITAQREVI
jgi:hypothetical protein